VPGEQNDNLPGWYYVYSNQAHAWTEIYLGPSLGWIDVDLTPEGESPAGPPPPPPTPPAPPDPLGAHYKLAAIVTKEGDSLRVSRAVLVEHAEERDSVLRVFPGRRQIRLDFDESVEERKGVSRERKLATVVASSLAEGDSLIATGRISSNPRALSDTCAAFAFYKLSPARRSADDRHAGAAAGDSVSTRRILAVALIAAVILVLLTAAALPSISLLLLSRRIRLTRSDEIRLQATRDWLLLSLHMQGISAGRETDLEFIDRAERVTGARLRSFINTWLEYRYTGRAPSGSSELCAPLVGRLWSALKAMRGTAGAVLRLANTWEYLRCINRRKTA